MLPERTTELLVLLARELEHVQPSDAGYVRLSTLSRLQAAELVPVCRVAARILYGFLEAPERVQQAVLNAEDQ